MAHSNSNVEQVAASIENSESGTLDLRDLAQDIRQIEEIEAINLGRNDFLVGSLSINQPIIMPKSPARLPKVQSGRSKSSLIGSKSSH